MWPIKKCLVLQSYYWTAEPKVVKFCTQVGYINSSNKMTLPTKGMWLWSRDCFTILLFALMQRVTQVHPRQLSYLFPEFWLLHHIRHSHDDVSFSTSLHLVTRSSQARSTTVIVSWRWQSKPIEGESFPVNCATVGSFEILCPGVQMPGQHGPQTTWMHYTSWLWSFGLSSCHTGYWQMGIYLCWPIHLDSFPGNLRTIAFFSKLSVPPQNSLFLLLAHTTHLAFFTTMHYVNVQRLCKH